MRKIKEVLRLKWSCGVSGRHIAKSCHISRSAVADCIHRAQAAGLSWPLPDGMNDTRLEALLYPPPAPSSFQRPMPDWAHIHQEMKHKSVTLFLLWQKPGQASVLRLFPCKVPLVGFFASINNVPQKAKQGMKFIVFPRPIPNLAHGPA